MKLIMVLKGMVVEAVPLNPLKWNKPGYVDHLKYGLLEEHDELIEQAGTEPVFLIEGVSSEANNFQSLLSQHKDNPTNDPLDEALYPSRLKKYKE